MTMVVYLFTLIAKNCIGINYTHDRSHTNHDTATTNICLPSYGNREVETLIDSELKIEEKNLSAC